MDEDEEEEESVCSSYCSSDLPPDGEEESSSKPAVTYWPQSDSLASLKKRILLWREHSEVPQLDSGQCSPLISPASITDLDCSPQRR